MIGYNLWKGKNMHMLHRAPRVSKAALSEHSTPVEERKDPPSPVVRRWKGDMVSFDTQSAHFDDSPKSIENRSAKPRHHIDRDVLQQVFARQSKDHVLRFLSLMGVDYEKECADLETLKDISEDAFRGKVLLRYEGRAIAVLEGTPYEALRLFLKAYEALPSDVLDAIMFK